MADLSQLRHAYGPAPTPKPPVSTASVVTSPLIQASTGQPYNSAASTRRTLDWNPSRLGPTTSLWASMDVMRARCRDEVRNNPWATSAIDNHESQSVGTGIWPRWSQIENPKQRKKIEDEFARWAIINNLSGLEALASREIFEAGEVFGRFHVRPSSWGLRVPLEIQLIEGEQVPVFLNAPAGGANNLNMAMDAVVRTGIEFDKFNRVVAYHMYREHPGESMFYPTVGMTYIRVPAENMLHVFKPLRTGLLRGQPHLASVLTMLKELDKFTDATVLKRQIQTMFAGFITKTTPEGDVLPIDITDPENGAGAVGLGYDPGVNVSKLEPGTLNVLLPGESITFPALPQDNDIETFLRVMLHRFAVGVGATYEQLTGDLKGVNYSSIRAGLLDFRRKCEQFQRNILIAQFIRPVVTRWLKEAVMAGVLRLPGYVEDPWQYENVQWSMPAWPWVDPLKDGEAALLNVRAGFDSRENICAEQGKDVSAVDAQQAADAKRAETYGLVYDSDATQILSKSETLEAAETAKANAAGAPGTGKAKPAKGGAKPKPGQSGKPAKKLARNRRPEIYSSVDVEDYTNAEMEIEPE